MIKWLVCGSRTLVSQKDYEWIEAKLLEVERERQEVPDVIVHGGAMGADTQAGRYGYNFRLDLEIYGAKWRTYGSNAGPIRNAQMLTEGHPDCVVAFSDGPLHLSRGTQNMVDQANHVGVPVYVFEKEF